MGHHEKSFISHDERWAVLFYVRMGFTYSVSFFVKYIFCVFIFARKGHKTGAGIGFQGEISRLNMGLLAFKMAPAARSAAEASRALNATPRLPGCTASRTIRTRPSSGFGGSIYLTKYKKRAIMGMVEEATQHGRIQGEGKYPGEE